MPLTSGLGSAALTPSGYGMRNAIINGDFSIDQRNGGNQQVITAGAALAYTVDRWYSYCTGANIAVRQQTASVPLRFRYQMAGSSGNTGAFLGQRIEAANSYHFAGKVAALSVYLQSSTITSVNWAVYRANTTDTFGTVASPTRTLIASGSLPVTSTMARQSVLMDIPTAATTGLEIVFSVPSLGGLDILFFGNVQFEANPQVTPFEQRPIGTELALCQRYYEVGEYQIQSLSTTNGATYYQMNRFAVLKRRAADVTVTSLGARGFSSTLTAATPDRYGWRADFVGTGSSTAYFEYKWTASAEL